MSDTAAPPPYAVVIPTLGRPSLTACLRALADAGEPAPSRIILVDDRPPEACEPLPVAVPETLRDRVEFAFGCAHGPAAARNAGWRAVREPWVVFLDDDVVPSPTWAADLAADLAAATGRTAAITARITVPLPADRRPTDWERGTAGLATARWITADMACRTAALEAVDGFDERFRRAFREDADLALRLVTAGWELTAGRRTTTHPVRPADRWVSLRVQAGNADDVLMTRRHGRTWWRRADAPRGRRPAHLAVTAAALGAVGCALAGRGRAAAGCAALWALGTAEFTWARLAPGPRTRAEVTTMALTSPLIPPLASYHWLRGLLRHRGVRPLPPGRPPTAVRSAAPLRTERV